MEGFPQPENGQKMATGVIYSPGVFGPEGSLGTGPWAEFHSGAEAGLGAFWKCCFTVAGKNPLAWEAYPDPVPCTILWLQTIHQCANRRQEGGLRKAGGFPGIPGEGKGCHPGECRVLP